MDDRPIPAAAANDRLIREFTAAWEQRDSDFIIACFSDNAVYHSMPLNSIVEKEAIAGWIRGFEDVPPGRPEIHNQVASDDIVMNERTDRIILNGHAVSLPIASVFEMKGGRIPTWREYFDLAPDAGCVPADHVRIDGIGRDLVVVAPWRGVLDARML